MNLPDQFKPDEAAPPAFTIERDGFFFRAVNAQTGWRSSLAACAAMAGRAIRAKAGAEAEADAAHHFLDAERAKRRMAADAPTKVA